jgi:hypothetical protein
MLASTARRKLAFPALILAALLAPNVPGRAAAARIVCRAQGTLHYEISSPVKPYLTWSAQGHGTCLDQTNRRYEVTFDTVYSQSYGVPYCPLDATYEWLMTVSISLRNKSSGVITERQQQWFGMLRDAELQFSGGTTYPIASTFGVAPVVDPLSEVPSGFGAIFSRIGGRCPPDGNDKASFVWQFPL